MMAQSASLVVEMIDDTIVVTLPGTDFFASYRKRKDVGALAAHFLQDDRHAALPRSEFVARSWRLALAKARELGWVL
jgi:hypothetical protein